MKAILIFQLQQFFLHNMMDGHHANTGIEDRENSNDQREYRCNCKISVQQQTQDQNQC